MVCEARFDLNAAEIDSLFSAAKVSHVSHARLDRVAHGSGFLSETMAPTDLALIEDALRHALGF